ncbi:MAG: hypothetical protein N3A66_05030, partial [Planctomycetota bacterium]|nr:hypothetical protein [Planctomycetota bacterium]
MRFSLRAFAVGLSFAALFAYVATVACNRQNLYEPAAQIAAVSLLFCLVLAVGINPLLRLLRLRPLCRGEIYLIFILATVPAGLPVFGYVCNVIPFAGGLHLYESNWNTSQSEWNEKITPYVDPDFFVGHAVFNPRHVSDWSAFVRTLANADQHPLLRHIAAGLPAEERKKLSELATAAGEVPEDFRLSLSRALRSALGNRYLIPPEALTAATLPPLAKELASRERSRLSDDEVETLNRLVLESACPEVKKVDFAAGREANRLYYRGLRVSGGEAFPVFIKKEDETFAAFADRLWRAFRRDPSLRQSDISDSQGLMRFLRESEPPSATAEIYARLPASAREVIERWYEKWQAVLQAERTPERSLTAALEALEKDADLYDANYFANANLPSAIKELVQRPAAELSAKEMHLRNRHLLEIACGGPGLDLWRAARKMAEAVAGPPSPAKRVWERLPDAARETARAAVAVEAEAEKARAHLLTGLNAVLETDLHAAPACASLLASADRDSPMPAKAKTHLNRLVLEKALAPFVKPYRLSFWGEIPWRPWLRPLFSWFWLAMALCLFFYTLNEILFRQWYEREKLIFPIAQFTSLVLGEEEREGRLPPLFLTLSFWLGFAIAFGIDLYNGMVNAHWLTGLQPIDLDGNIDRKLEGTALSGLCYGFRLHIFFACIGLAFLLPTEILFSVWFFFALMKAQQLLAVWLGYGTDSNSFP